MIIVDNNTNKKRQYNKYISDHVSEKFFIIPFTCPICNNTHAFEKGIIVYKSIRIDHCLYKAGHKICDICSVPIRADIKRKWNNFYETGAQDAFEKDIWWC